MATPKSKANVGLTLVILFLITLTTGFMLHQKSHGAVVQSCGILNVIHGVSGLLMVCFLVWHAVDFKKMLGAMKKKFLWFWVDTRLVEVFTLLTFVSGLLKLLSPLKMPHVGLWHYGFGIIMSVTIIVHLYRGLPSWNRLRKIRKTR